MTRTVLRNMETNQHYTAFGGRVKGEEERETVELRLKRMKYLQKSDKGEKEKKKKKKVNACQRGLSQKLSPTHHHHHHLSSVFQSL